MKSGELVAGRYRLDARLGIGGMGEVWKATHTGTGSEFALKFLHAHAATSASARQRFTREARVSAKINHPNVIDIFDVGELEDGILYLAMELLEGIALSDALHAAPPLSVQEFLTVILDTTRALVAAHGVGIVHRDIKPANIFLHQDRETGFASGKILDFGISKFGGNDDQHHTKTGAVLGSPRYMSPEQTRSAASVDARADLWAVGVILFEGLTGTWPHEGDSFSSLVVAICTTPPTSIDLMVPDLPEPLRAVIRACLKPLDQRIQSAVELETRLGAVLMDPIYARMPLPRPLHPPSEALKTVSGVRIRPYTLTTTGGSGPVNVQSTQDRAGGSRPSSSSPAAPPPSAFGRSSPALPTHDGGPAAPPPSASPRSAPAPRPRQPTQQMVVDPSASETTQVRPLPTPGALSRSSPALPAPGALPRSSPALPAPGALSRSSPALPAPVVIEPPSMFSSTTPMPPMPHLSGIMPAPGQSPDPAFKAHARTMPLDAAAQLQAQLLHAGMLAQPAAAQPAATEPPAQRSHTGTASITPPSGAQDSLVGTVSRMSFETRPSAVPPEVPGPAPSPTFTPMPSPLAAMPIAGPATATAPAPNKGLRVMVGALSVLLVGIIMALVSVLRSGPAGEVKPASGGVPVSSVSVAPSTATPAVTAEPAPPAPPPAVTAEPTPPAPTASATAAPTSAPDRGRPAAPVRPPSKAPGSKIQKLGSGL